MIVRTRGEKKWSLTEKTKDGLIQNVEKYIYLGITMNM